MFSDLLNQKDPVIVLSNFETSKNVGFSINKEDDIDILLKYIDPEIDYLLEIVDIFADGNFVNLMQLLNDKNKFYCCCCEKKEYLQKQSECLKCQKPLSRIKELNFGAYCCVPITNIKICMPPETLV